MGEPLQLSSASYLLRGRPAGLVGPGPSQQRHDLLHLGLGGTGFAVPQVMPSFGAGQAMGGTGAPVGPAIFARTGSGVRRNEHAERPSVTVHQTVNPSPGMDERDLATKTSRELMYRIGY